MDARHLATTRRGNIRRGRFLEGALLPRTGADRAEEITCTTWAINCKEGGYSVASKVVTPDSHALSSTNQLSLLKARTYTNDNNFSFTHPRRSRFEPPSSIRAQRSSCGRLRSPFYAKLVMDHPRPWILDIIKGYKLDLVVSSPTQNVFQSQLD